MDLKMAYYLLDSYGLMRFVARYVRSETGMGEGRNGRLHGDLQDCGPWGGRTENPAPQG